MIKAGERLKNERTCQQPPIELVVLSLLPTSREPIVRPASNPGPPGILSAARVEPPDEIPAVRRPLRAVTIGTGKISEEHLKFLGTTGRRAGLSVVAGVCDLSPAMAKFAAGRFAAEAAYTDYKTMLAEARPDVVHILTPPHTHARLVADCLAAGVHVLVEKPVAPTHAEFLTLAEQARFAGKRLIEDHNYRFNAPVLAIEKLVAAGDIGDVREVDVRMSLAVRSPGGRYMDTSLPHPSHRLPCGVIHEFVTHLGYLALRFLPTVDRVAAAWSKHATDTLFKYDDLDALLIGGPVHGRLRFTSHAGPDGFMLTVRGTDGWVETDLFQPHLRVVKPRRGGKQLSPLVNQFVNGMELVRSSVLGFRNKIMQVTPYEGLQTFLHRTYMALQSGAEPPVTFDDMDRVSRLVDALLEDSNRV
jgi:predicted dehydrogenase